MRIIVNRLKTGVLIENEYLLSLHFPLCNIIHLPVLLLGNFGLRQNLNASKPF
jgi:hypothetical protein